MTPLHLAAIHGHRGVAQLLLALGADVDARVYQRYGSKCEKLCTALYLATICGDLAVVRALIEAGADVNTAFGQHSCYTVLHYAAYEGSLDLIRLLLHHGAEIERRDRSHMTALWKAVLSGREEVVRELVDAGADAMAYRDVEFPRFDLVCRTVIEYATSALSLAWALHKYNIYEFLLEADPWSRMQTRAGRLRIKNS